jgi:hypothetical protein
VLVQLLRSPIVRETAIAILVALTEVLTKSNKGRKR